MANFKATLYLYYAISTSYYAYIVVFCN